MLTVDMEVRFVPAHLCRPIMTTEERVTATVRGNIVYVNYAHKYFTAEYEWEGLIHKESFKFADCGKTVTVRGRC